MSVIMYPAPPPHTLACSIPGGDSSKETVKSRGSIGGQEESRAGGDWGDGVLWCWTGG